MSYFHVGRQLKCSKSLGVSKVLCMNKVNLFDPVILYSDVRNLPESDQFQKLKTCMMYIVCIAMYLCILCT